ncbi:MAG: zinc-ribbon domain-containing protein [Proteobacteria bacterium]|nr:zinc-ribbon domain-containing protein [Pseudomonadota bacterium]
MKFQCQSCQAVFRVDDSKVPTRGAYGRCPNCRERIFVRDDLALPETPDSVAQAEPAFRPAAASPDQPAAPAPKPSPAAAPKPRSGVARERFRTTFMAVYALSSLVPTLILLYIAFQIIAPRLTPGQAPAIMDTLTYALLGMLLIPFLGFMLMSWWMRSLEQLTEKIRLKTSEVLQEKIQITEKNELVALEQHIDGLYDELQDKIDQLNAYSEQLVESKQKLSELSITDELTRLNSRRQFDRLLRAEFDRAARNKRPLSLIMLEIHDFDEYAKAFGIPAGDGLLKGMSHLIRDYVGKSGLPFRYGESDFAILLPEVGIEAAAETAQKIVDATLLTIKSVGRGEEPGKTSIGCGVALLPPGLADPGSEVERCRESAAKAARGKVFILPPKKTR